MIIEAPSASIVLNQGGEETRILVDKCQEISISGQYITIRGGWRMDNSPMPREKEKSAIDLFHEYEDTKLSVDGDLNPWVRYEEVDLIRKELICRMEMLERNLELNGIETGTLDGYISFFDNVGTLVVGVHHAPMVKYVLELTQRHFTESPATQGLVTLIKTDA